jgi:hypothetical protein
MRKIIKFNKIYSCFFIFTVFITVIGSGCGKSPREVARFAKAGTTYTLAMDNLLVRAGDLQVDANSEAILYADVRRADREEYLKQYRALTDADIERLKVINQLRTHTKLLAHYFELLYELSTTDAPDRTATAIEGTVKNLNEFGTSLRTVPTIDENVTKVISGLTKFVVTAKIRAALNRELEARKDVILKEIITQEELLNYLSEDIKQNLMVVGKTREKRLVIDPLLADEPISMEDREKWKANRKAAITAIKTIDDLKTANKAVKKLREAYESLFSGKLNIEKINDALADFEIIISSAEAIKNLTGE